MFNGSCHCGEVRWSFAGPIESVTACNCTLCRKYGALWAYGHLNKEVSVSGKSKMYSRGSQINGFHFCENCGGLCYYMALKPDESGLRRTAVNIRMIDDPKKIENLPIDHFEGLVTFEDLPRDHRCVKDMWY